VYPVLFVDAINVRIREGKVVNRPVYVVVAVTVEGTRDILGIWVGDGGEGAEYWLQVFTELKNRGLDGVLMLVCDGLRGLPDAVGTVWPRTIEQTCVVHLPRDGFRYAWRADGDKIAKALKPVCTAPNESAAAEPLGEFQDAWGKKYPAIVQLWENAWAEFVPFLSFDVEISAPSSARRTPLSPSTRGYARPSGARGHFPTGAAALKCVYMALMSPDPTGKGRKRWAMRWKAPLNAFQIAFEGRLTPANH
jgi:putative transposase